LTGFFHIGNVVSRKEVSIMSDSPLRKFRTGLGLSLEDFHKEFHRRLRQRKQRIPLALTTLRQYELGWKSPDKVRSRALAEVFPGLDRNEIQDYRRDEAVSA
jgi:hypothetical protein